MTGFLFLFPLRRKYQCISLSVMHNRFFNFRTEDEEEEQTAVVIPSEKCILFILLLWYINASRYVIGCDGFILCNCCSMVSSIDFVD